MRRGTGALVAALLVVTVAGCGQQPEPDISAQAAKVLGADVDAITAAARAKDATKVQQALKTLRGHVDAQQASGELSPERASQILAAGARVAIDVGVPAPKVVVSRVPAPPAPDLDRGKDDKKDEGKKDDEDKEEKDKDDD